MIHSAAFFRYLICKERESIFLFFSHNMVGNRKKMVADIPIRLVNIQSCLLQWLHFYLPVNVNLWHLPWFSYSPATFPIYFSLILGCIALIYFFIFISSLLIVFWCSSILCFLRTAGFSLIFFSTFAWDVVYAFFYHLLLLWKTISFKQYKSSLKNYWIDNNDSQNSKLFN